MGTRDKSPSPSGEKTDGKQVESKQAARVKTQKIASPRENDRGKQGEKLSPVAGKVKPGERADANELILYAVAITAFALLIYWDSAALSGEFVYDDAGTVSRNALMNETRPMSDILTHDYWGELLVSPTSHKSFRPITTFSFRANFEMVGLEPYAFHVTNIVVNALVSTLSVFVADIVFEGDRVPVILTGLLFAAHPIHTEAVSNVTGRAELLMALFYLLGFLVFVRNRRMWVAEKYSPHAQAVGTYLAPLGLAAASMLCKENGLMLAVTCGLYDYLQMDATVTALMYDWLRGTKKEVNSFFVRSIIAAVGFGIIGYYRLSLNGATKPDFIYDQNPAAFHNDTLTRVLSINMVYTLYLRSFFVPTDLCCDWSGVSIPLVTQPLTDVRTLGVILLHVVFWRSVFHALFLKNPLERQSKLERMWVRVITIGLLGFTFCPFFFSSNILVGIGTMKAERLAYFPSYGMVMFVVAILMTAHHRITARFQWKSVHGFQQILWAMVAVLLFLYVAKTKERNLAWSSGLSLWESAYKVNQRSGHTQYNYGLELAKVSRHQEALDVMKKSHETDPNDLTTIFVYSIVLRATGNCSVANVLINQGLDRLEKIKNKEIIPERPDNMARDMSNLLAIKALCSDDIGYMGKTLYKAIEIDPTNEYAVNRGTELLAQVEVMRAKGISPHQIPLQQMLNF